MTRIRRKAALSAAALALGLGAVGGGIAIATNGDGDDRPATTAGAAGEESGTQLALSETFDKVRNGARLVMSYDPASNTFTGTVTNTTNQTLDQVRVEVHLSNGTELGPTTPIDLAPGASTDVTLKATAQPFGGWSPRAEVGVVGGAEQSAGGESGSEGGGRGGEHGPGGESGRS